MKIINGFRKRLGRFKQIFFKLKSAKKGERLYLLKIFIIILVIFFILVVARNKALVKTAPGQIVPVRVMKVELRNVSKVLEYVGNITAQDEAVVYPKVSGKVVEKIKEDGALVGKGDIIAYIDRDEVGLKFEKAPVETPLSGIIGRVYVDRGTNVNVQTPIALVVDMDKVKVSLDIPEQYLPKISLEQEALISVDAYPDEEFKGKVTKISPVVELTTRSSPIEILIDNPGHRLNPGMFAKVSLVIEEHKNVPAILKEAIMGKEPELYVFTVEDKKANLKRIKLGLRQGPYYEVTEGVKEGDAVVIMGQERVREGMPVAPEE